MRYRYDQVHKDFWMFSLKSLEKAVNLSPDRKLLNFEPEDADLIAVLYLDWSYFQIFYLGHSYLLYFKPIDLKIEDDWFSEGDSFFYEFYTFENIADILDEIIRKFINQETINRYFGRWWSYLPLWMMPEIDYIHECYEFRLRLIAEKIIDANDFKKHLNEHEYRLLNDRFNIY